MHAHVRRLLTQRMSAAPLPDRRTVGLVALAATWKVAAQPDVSSGSLLKQPLPGQPVA
jgi:hypothetical protein